MNDKEKLEAIYEIINKKAEEMDDPPVDRGTSTSLPKNLWTDIPEYKKEITEHFDRFFKSPEFERMMDKAIDG